MKAPRVLMRRCMYIFMDTCTCACYMYMDMYWTTIGIRTFKRWKTWHTELPTFSTTVQALNHWATKTQIFTKMAAIQEATTRQRSIFMKIQKYRLFIFITLRTQLHKKTHLLLRRLFFTHTHNTHTHKLTTECARWHTDAAMEFRYQQQLILLLAVMAVMISCQLVPALSFRVKARARHMTLFSILVTKECRPWGPVSQEMDIGYFQ